MTLHTPISIRTLILFLITISLMAPALPAHAMTIEVPPGDVPALIAAIETANNSPGPDVINLADGVYTLTEINNEGVITIEDREVVIRGANGLPILRDEVTINGGGAIIERAEDAPSFRIMAVFGTATLNNLTLRNGSTYWESLSEWDMGGGIFNYGNMTLNECQIIANTASSGGGIANKYGTVTVNRSVISGNRAWGSGGGIEHTSGSLFVNESTITDNLVVEGVQYYWSSGLGGGIAFGSGIAIVSASTISNNHVMGHDISRGGGVYAVNGIYNTMEIGNNSTISGNSAGEGGGIYANGAFAVRNITVANNTASENGGGVFGAYSDYFDFFNTIVADNQPTNCARINGSFHSEGNNLDSDGSCELDNDDLSNIDRFLSPLTSNGGLTQTHALLPESPAINAGDPATCTTHDQRGALRDSTCDIGAYEVASVHGEDSTDAVPSINMFTTATPTLTWNPLAGARGFQLQVDDDWRFFSPNYNKADLPAGILSHTLLDPLPEGIYYWRIRVKRSNQRWGAWSWIDTFAVITP